MQKKKKILSTLNGCFTQLLCYRPSLRHQRFSLKWHDTTDGVLCFHSYSSFAAPPLNKTSRGLFKIVVKFPTQYLPNAPFNNSQI